MDKEVLSSDVRHDKVQGDGINSDGIAALPTVIYFVWHDQIPSKNFGFRSCSEKSIQLFKVRFTCYDFTLYIPKDSFPETR